MTSAERVTAEAEAARAALIRRDAAIRAMADEGASLRTIGTAAGLTHAGVRKILLRRTT